MSFSAANYTITRGKDWFLSCELKRDLHKFVDFSECHKILEIGSYEGVSSCFFSDMLLGNQKSRLICVDPFDLKDTTTKLTSHTQKTFLSNIGKSRNSDKVKLFCMTSDEFFAKCTDTFDLIYVDGSHVPDQITRDLDHSWTCLTQGGIMWMDDYMQKSEITKCINAWISAHDHALVIHRGYQVAVKKV